MLKLQNILTDVLLIVLDKILEEDETYAYVLSYTSERWSKLVNQLKIRKNYKEQDTNEYCCINKYYNLLEWYYETDQNYDEQLIVRHKTPEKYLDYLSEINNERINKLILKYLTTIDVFNGLAQFEKTFIINNNFYCFKETLRKREISDLGEEMEKDDYIKSLSKLAAKLNRMEIFDHIYETYSLYYTKILDVAIKTNNKDLLKRAIQIKI